MAENLMAYYNIEKSRGYSQILITAHNGHVMKYDTSKIDDVNMGVKINELFEGSYYCVGTEFYNTCVNVHTAGTYDDEYERANHDYCSDDLLAYQAQYFDDEDLDRFRGRSSDSYQDDEVEEFRYVMYTMQQNEVREWMECLQAREIELPDELKEECYSMMNEID